MRRRKKGNDILEATQNDDILSLLGKADQATVKFKRSPNKWKFYFHTWNSVNLWRDYEMNWKEFIW